MNQVHQQQTTKNLLLWKTLVSEKTENKMRLEIKPHVNAWLECILGFIANHTAIPAHYNEPVVVVGIVRVVQPTQPEIQYKNIKLSD